MLFLGILSLTIYCIFFLIYFKNIFQSKRSHWIYYFAMVIINIGITQISGLVDMHLLRVLIILCSMLFSFQLLFYGNHMQILYAGSIYIFSLYSSRGIIASIYSLILNDSINETLQEDANYYTILMLSVLLSILLNVFIRKVIMPDTLTRHMLNNKGQLRFMVSYLLLQLIYLIVINDGRFLDVKQPWFSAILLMSCIISKLGLQIVIDHTGKVSEILEYELHTRQLQEQISSQLRHYQSYLRFTESYRAFRHDYVNMMTSVKTLLRNQEYEKAARMLDSIHDTMQNEVQIHKSYSNNILLDAILQDTSNTCAEKGIRFLAVAHLPESTSLSELDIVRVFTNIVDNAVEACNRIAVGDRFIEITSNGNQDWATIEVSNSFNGEIFFRGDEPLTTKECKDFHGLGLKIIRETLEGLGGLLFIEANQEKGIFKLKLCIPKAD
jgi:two-component system, LytTR family, sensor histidine kinase AgrC